MTKVIKKIERNKGTIERGKGKISKLPRLETIFEDDGDPLEDVEYDDGNLELSADRELSEIVKQIKERRQARMEMFRVARDPDYWFALCFQSREQRDEFLQKSGWIDLGDKYLNGLAIARRLGLDVPPVELKPIPLRGNPKKYSEKEVI